MTQPGETSLAVPPLAWNGAPQGRVPRLTASARMPNGRPISWLESAWYFPGSSCEVSRALSSSACLGGQKMTVARLSSSLYSG